MSNLALFLAAFDQTLWIPIVGVGGVLIFFAAGWFSKKRRSQAIESEARRAGFTFRRIGSAEDKELMARSCLWCDNHDDVNNVMEPPSPPGDLRMRALDYAYSYDNGKTREFARQTAVHVQSPLLRLPSFLLRPQSSLAKLGKILGLAHDIDFAEAPRFRGMFLLRSENEAAVRSLFTPGVIAQCEQLPGISIGGAGDALVVYRDRKLARVTDLPARLAEAKAIALLFITAAAATA